MVTIKVHSSKTSSIQRKHPWIFSGALLRNQPLPKDGARVLVTDEKDRVLGTGHFQQGGSISVRLLSFGAEELDQEFWTMRLQNALNVRQSCIPGFGEFTNCFRWIHGEGDGLPGLIMDVYGDAVVIQCHSSGMESETKHLNSAISAILPEMTTVYVKQHNVSGDGSKLGYFLKGDAEEGRVLENGIHIHCNWVTGQKTGFFLDQRENRSLLKRYAQGKKVLDLFCNIGGFGLYALAGGASKLVSVDISERATALLQQNVSANPFDLNAVEIVIEDVLKYLNQNEEKFDIVVLDPPAFAKSISKRHNAIQAYKRHNLAAIMAIQPNGLLFTFSCSQVVDEELFYNTVVAASIESGRNFRVLHKLSQAPDHPVNIFHREGAYLKGLVLEVE